MYDDEYVMRRGDLFIRISKSNCCMYNVWKPVVLNVGTVYKQFIRHKINLFKICIVIKKEKVNPQKRFPDALPYTHGF